MTAIALKKYLVSRINLTEDNSILDKIKEIVDKEQSKVYLLNDFQLERLEESKKQFANGEFFTQDEVDLKIEKWFNEK